MRHSPTLGLCVITFCCAELVLAQSSKSNSSANPDLVGQLTKALSVTPAQANGGAGALFGLAKSRLSADDFTKLAGSVPGIEGLIKSAPAASKNSALPAGLGSAIPGGLGGLAAVAGPFKKLGMPPELAGKFVPVLVQYVQGKGGAGVAGLLAGALK